jgi:hypothetical protein
MGLTRTGSTNKKENVEKAYGYLDQVKYPNLDTDACDAVLMAMMGRYSSALLLGHPENLPQRFLLAMTNAAEEVVGKGRNARTRTKGLLHRPEYWRGYERQLYTISVRDANLAAGQRERFARSSEIALLPDCRFGSPAPNGFPGVVEAWVLPNMRCLSPHSLASTRPERSAPRPAMVHFSGVTGRNRRRGTSGGERPAVYFDLIFPGAVEVWVSPNMSLLSTEEIDDNPETYYSLSPRGPPYWALPPAGGIAAKNQNPQQKGTLCSLKT